MRTKEIENPWDRCSAAKGAIDLWDGKDYFQLMVRLSEQLGVNLFDVHYKKMRMKTGVRVKNKHTGDEGYIDQIVKSSIVYEDNGPVSDGEPYYHLKLDGGSKDGLQAKSFWEHWDVLD